MLNVVIHTFQSFAMIKQPSLCAESEQIGAHTMEHMGRQREQLERSAGLIQQSLENTEQARKILKEM
jgi:hypothetical protein